MEEDPAVITKKDRTLAFGPLSILASGIGLVCIPSIYGSIISSGLGALCGLLAIRNKQKVLGIIGIVLNLTVLAATIVLVFALTSFSPE